MVFAWVSPCDVAAVLSFTWHLGQQLSLILLRAYQVLNDLTKYHRHRRGGCPVITLRKCFKELSRKAASDRRRQKAGKTPIISNNEKTPISIIINFLTSGLIDCERLSAMKRCQLQNATMPTHYKCMT